MIPDFVLAWAAPLIKTIRDLSKRLGRGRMVILVICPWVIVGLLTLALSGVAEWEEHEDFIEGETWCLELRVDIYNSHEFLDRIEWAYHSKTPRELREYLQAEHQGLSLWDRVTSTYCSAIDKSKSEVSDYAHQCPAAIMDLVRLKGGHRNILNEISKRSGLAIPPALRCEPDKQIEENHWAIRAIVSAMGRGEAAAN